MPANEREGQPPEVPSEGGVPASGSPSNVLLLPEHLERSLSESDDSFGALGRPFNRRSPFFIGLTAAFGVAVAYVIVRGVADVTAVLVIIGMSLFIAVGLNPIIEFMVSHGRTRTLGVVIVTLSFIVLVAAFVVAAVPPISHEVHTLIKNFPHYRAQLIAGKGWAGRIVKDAHLTSYLKGSSKLKIPYGGVLGAGKAILSIGVSTISVIVLTIYFLSALPRVKRLWLSLVPRSRRERVSLLTEEVFERVGGFMLGNLLTSVVAGVGTYVWLLIFGVPYAVLLALSVALLDLIPMVGSTVGGIIVSLVALTKGLPIAIATAVFYTVYRFMEDYLLNPRVMKHTVKVSPGLTIIATLTGGALLGILGALVAIPVAATVHLLIEEVAIPRQNQH